MFDPSQDLNITRYEGEFDPVQFGLSSLKPFEFVDEPTIICDLSNIVSRVRLWQNKLPRVKLFHPMKDNYDPVVIRMLERLGVKFSCASKEEIRSMRIRGVNPSDLLFANPVKIISHLRYAQKQHVELIVVDSLDELEKVKMYHPEAKILLKISSQSNRTGTAINGCDPQTDALRLMMESKALELNLGGICFNIDTKAFDPVLYKTMLITTKTLFDYGKGILGLNLDTLSIGGGIPSSIDEEQFGFFSAVVNKTICELFPETDIQILAEPGQFLVGPSMTLFCNVQSRRELDNGQQMGYYINFLGMLTSPKCIETDSEGENICIPSVILGDDNSLTESIPLPMQYVGDVLYFENMGVNPQGLNCHRFKNPTVKYFLKKSSKIIL